jgi:hypothetical protein
VFIDLVNIHFFIAIEKNKNFSFCGGEYLLQWEKFILFLDQPIKNIFSHAIFDWLG